MAIKKRIFTHKTIRMHTISRLVTLLGCLFLSLSLAAQPSKTKTAKPAVKPATAVKKTDYTKMKADIRGLFRNEDYKAVITKATQYLAKNPGDTQVTMQKAVSHVALKQYNAGFSQVKNFFNTPDTAAKYLAIMAFQVPDSALLTSGVLCADEAIKLVPAGPWGYFAKAGIYSDQQQHDQSLPVMEEMSKRLRNDTEQQMLAPFYAKEMAFNKQHEKALALIDVLYKKFPGDGDIIDTYAFIYRYNKNYGKAVEKYNELLKLYPGNIDVRLAKAKMLSNDGKTAEACTETEGIIAADSMYEFLRYRYKCPAYFVAPAISDIKTASWAVDFSGNNYDFSVSNIKGNTADGMEFDWSMTSSDDMKGHISLTKEAMATAIAQNNRFSADMKNTVMNDKTTVWISGAVMNDLLTKAAAKMDAGYGEEIFTVVPDNADAGWDENAFEEKIMVKGALKYVNTIHVKNADGDHQLWILHDAKNPLIIKMQFDWGITLKSID